MNNDEFIKECLQMAQEESEKNGWSDEDYKEYDFISVEKDGYKCSIYKDNMFGMEFANASIYDKDGKEIMHATLRDGVDYTEQDAMEILESFLAHKGEK